MLALLLFLLASPIDAITFVSVNYTLLCQYPPPYTYSIKLIEVDEGPNDLIAKTTEVATSGMYQSYIGGWDNGDEPTPSYEFRLVLEHNCGGNLEPREKELDLESCPTAAKYCDYDMVWVDLE